LDINQLQLIAQIHSFYITNIKSELKFSKENFNEEELETIVNEISENLIKDNEDEDNSFDLDNEKDKTNFNDLLIAELIDLNFYDNNESETNLFLNQQQLEEKENLNVDLETILAKEF
ncbi:7188_t:CDS:2, partial [Dentiscutata heterogama]